MRRFSLSLNVRCQYCHAGGDGVSFKDVDFASDDKLPKRRARFMLQMVDSLNNVVMPKLPGLEGSALRIECKTCHRGYRRPLLLTQELAQVIDTGGIASAVARYKALREREGMEGRWDFSEWEMNLWSEKLAAAGKDAEAIAMYQLNLEYFPRSTSILSNLARLYEKSDRAKAISYWEQALAIQDVPQIRKRLDSLKALP
jgi:tetratricopeptide (TPR) repeat protein